MFKIKYTHMKLHFIRNTVLFYVNYYSRDLGNAATIGIFRTQNNHNKNKAFKPLVLMVYLCC